MVDVDRLLAEADATVPARWPLLEQWFRERFGREPALEPVLFMVGVQSRGTGYTPQLEKDEKQDLIIQGSYVVLEELGLRASPDPESADADGARSVSISSESVDRQESLLKLGAIRYFEQFMDSP